jgi:hypothetical protein
MCMTSVQKNFYLRHNIVKPYVGSGQKMTAPSMQSKQEDLCVRQACPRQAMPSGHSRTAFLLDDIT